MKTTSSMCMLVLLFACSSPTEPTAPDAAATLPGKDVIALPARCARIGALYRCNPVTNEGCDGSRGEACDVDPDHGFGCYPPPNEVLVGGDCNVDEGPSCSGGLACVTDGTSADGTCARFCCGDGDCAAGQRCVSNDPTFGTLGVCK